MEDEWEEEDIDSDKPIMQVGQHMFAGEYEDALGTCVLFEEGAPRGKTESSPVVKYMCHTVKKLMMQRIFLTEKKESESDIGDGKEQDTTCLSSREDNVNQTGQEVEEANLEDTAAVEM
ncbi:general transcription factor 3C polypeptide 6 isoform X3 [Thalassophryne amazonica]|uniref:general transcription factor 3C polypeptide 6 isoform X3 n=1 Tax=Thalassophryne amazonica TaxID=390379 RepID=UPI001470E976|nr:general transcription factor 3C polypeptide 6 isoform X3 [Thalassophryne amazonica]